MMLWDVKYCMFSYFKPVTNSNKDQIIQKNNELYTNEPAAAY